MGARSLSQKVVAARFQRAPLRHRFKTTTRQVTETLGFPGVFRRGWVNCPVGSTVFRVLHADQVLIGGEFGNGPPAIRYPTLLYA